MQYLQIKCFRRRFIARQYFLIINFSSGRNWIPIRYVEYEFEKGLYPPKPSFEQTNIFILSCAACVVASIVFSKGAPYRKHLFTNGRYITKRTSFNYFPLFLFALYIVVVTIFVVANTNYYLRHLIFFSRLLIHKIIYTRFDEMPQNNELYLLLFQSNVLSQKNNNMIIYKMKLVVD